MMDLIVFVPNHHHSITMAHSSFHTLSNTETIIRISNDPVDDYFNIVGFVAVYLHFGDHFHDHTINPNFGEAHFADLHKEFAIMTFSTFDNRSKDDQLFTFKILYEVIDDLVFRLADHRFTC